MGFRKYTKRSLGILLVLAQLISSAPAHARSKEQTLLLIQILLALFQRNLDVSELDAGSRINRRALNPRNFRSVVGNPFINSDPFRNDPFGDGDPRFAATPSRGGAGFDPSTGSFNPQSALGNSRRNDLVNLGNLGALQNRSALSIDSLGRVSPRPLSSSRVFRDTEKHSQGTKSESGRSYSDDTSELCGGKAYEAICGPMDASQRKETIELTQNVVDQAVNKSAIEAGGIDKLEQVLSDVSTESLAPKDQKLYESYLSNLSGNLDLTDLVRDQKKAIADAIERGKFMTDKTDALDALFTARVVETPNPEIPGEVSTFNEHCGANGLQNNAFACANHEHGRPLAIYICPGRKAAALARAGGDRDLALADLSHTVLHELSHLIGVAKGSPFNADYRPLLACIAPSTGMKPAELEESILGAEYTAEHGAGLGLAQNLADGMTFGLSPGAYVKVALQRLCGTGGKDHPSDKIRMEIAMSELKSDPRSRAKLHCAIPTGAKKSCALGDSK